MALYKFRIIIIIINKQESHQIFVYFNSTALTLIKSVLKLKYEARI